MQRYDITMSFPLNQPLSGKLPVTVLSGFLGAGKTKQSSLVFIGPAEARYVGSIGVLPNGGLIF
jgi:hypothetical protein